MQVNSERWAVAYRSGMTSPPYELDLTVDNDSDWVDDLTQEEDDSAGEDSVSMMLFVMLHSSIQGHKEMACTRHLLRTYYLVSAITFRSHINLLDAPQIYSHVLMTIKIL